ncbi:MAG: AMIN domain-containing protein [Anaerotruncus sp.]|nr:AMIN domain-containing protein [Anaerotruncus sp.]
MKSAARARSRSSGLVSPWPAAPQDDPRAEIVNLRKFTHPNFTRVVLDIGKLREYTFGELRDPGRIYIDVLQAKLNPILQGQSYPVKADYISQIRISQKTPSTVRLVVDVDFSRDPVLPGLPPARPLPSGHRRLPSRRPGAGPSQTPAQTPTPAEKPASPATRVPAGREARGRPERPEPQRDVPGPPARAWASGPSSSIPATADRGRGRSARAASRRRRSTWASRWPSGSCSGRRPGSTPS